MSYLNSFIDICTVQRFTEGAADDYGHPAKIWADYLTGEPCRLVVGSGREINVGAEVVIADYKLFMENVTITEQDRVKVYWGTIDAWVEYEILLVKDRQDGTDSHHKELLLRTVR